MAIESIGAGSAASYQAISSDAAVKPSQQAKDAQVEQSSVAKTLVNETVDLKVNPKESSNQEDAEHPEQKSHEDIKKSIAEINKNINKHTEAKFDIHEKTKRVTIKIVDKDTQEVIREVPPEKTLDMIAKVWELAGLLVDEKR